MKNIFTVLSIFALIILSSCGSTDPRSTEPDYDALAKDLCTCLQPMFDLQGEIMKKMAEGQEEEIMAMAEQAMQIQADGESCVNALEQKYGIIEGDEKEAKATEALRKTCPEIVAMMESSADPTMMEDMPIDDLEDALQDEGQE